MNESLTDIHLENIMELKYRGVAYTPKAQTSVYPFTAKGCYRGRPIQIGVTQPHRGLQAPLQLTYRGVQYQID